MRIIVDECVSCDLPCINCGRKHVERIVCDCCEEPLDWDGISGIEYHGKELCEECAKQELIVDFFDTIEKKRAFYRVPEVNPDEFPCDIDELTHDELLEYMEREDVEVIAKAAGIQLTKIKEN